MKIWLAVVAWVGCLLLCSAKKHHLELQGDDRRYFPISTFGFYRNGYLSVDVSKFKILPSPDRNQLFGFSLEKTANPYTDNHPEQCELTHLQVHDALVQRVLLTFNTTALKVTVRCSEDMRDLHIYEDMRQVVKQAQQSQGLHRLADTVLFSNKQRRMLPSDPETSGGGGGGRFRRAIAPPPSSDGANAADGEDSMLPPGAGDGDSGSAGSMTDFQGDAARVSDATGVSNIVGVTSSFPSAYPTSEKIIVPEVKCNDVQLPITYRDGVYNFSFVVFVANEKEEGLYNLNFHNCHNYEMGQPRSSIDMTLMVIELNPDDNYLSAGEMPLPALYFMMSLLFMLSAGFWFFLLRKSNETRNHQQEHHGWPRLAENTPAKSGLRCRVHLPPVREPVFKIHYLMGVLVVIKSLSLLLHAINYHFIQIQGTHMEAWAVMYYIMHLLKGALLFTVLALIGSGWAFIKHILSSKEKKIFMIVIPLQIIANVASIIIEETDEWDPEQAVWARLLFLLDFLCCAAILLPVVWSIRHLQEASQTDGKAAMNLSKLKLFRHFYIMVVCYIYFTRIIVYLLRITVPFQYEWLDDMFREMATYVFFVLTGYKFRPANSNPYFLLAYRDEDEDVVLTTTGMTESVNRVNQEPGMGGRNKITRQDSSDALTQVVHQDDSELNLLLSTKEDSHDLD